MKNDHIIGLIDSKPIGSLNEDELTAIQSHVRECEACLGAFQAAQVSGSLLKERAAAEFAPSPFFHTRVLATLRERQAANESWGFSRLWRAAGALASTMVATVATLAILTFVVPETQVSSLSSMTSAEEVILNQTSQLDDESDSPLLTIYGGEDESAR